METAKGSPQQVPDDHDPVPIFGSWPRIYAAVVLNAILWMGLIALFQHWRY